jgi:hypothetical protein
MMRGLAILRISVGVGVLLLLPTLARAQASISGTAQDASGGVLPGVTVEAASPVLIEKTRTAITDSAGRFSIVDLRPGTYTVTFTLTGFTAVKREGIVLQGTFDAQVNAELRVGAVQETITVSGASPVVDVKNNITQMVLTKEQIEVLPGDRTLKGRAALIPGVVIPGANTGVVAHGSDSQDSHTMMDGFKSGQHLVGRGTGQLGIGSVTQTQEATIEELVYSTDSQGAEYSFSGVRMNMIPKEGGNRTKFETIAYGSNQHFEWNNLGDLQTGPAPIKYAPQLFFFDFNPVIGGPIKENKLWYFGSVSAQRNNAQQLDIYFKPYEPSTPADCRDKPLVPSNASNAVNGFDPTQWCQAYTGAVMNWSETIRVTHQLSSKQKLRYSFDNAKYNNLYGNYVTSGAKASPEASWNLPLFPTWLAQVKYTSPITNRLLIEGGYSYQRGDFRVNYQPANATNEVSKWDVGRGFIEDNVYFVYNNQERKQEAKAAVSYVTGSHSVKVGVEDRWANAIQFNPYNSDVAIDFTLNNTPILVDVSNGPSVNKQVIKRDGGLFGQDQWRYHRFTINLGVRWDWFNAMVPSQTNPASNFTPAITTPDINNVPNWNDWNTRTGVAWDVFGTGKTAIKAFAGRFVAGHALDITSQTNPIYSQTDRRTWTDLNHDGTTLNSDGSVQFNEIGPPNNKLFGTLQGVTQIDPNLQRDKNWTYELTGSHELFPNVSVGGGYYHRHYYDLNWVNNTAVGDVNSGDWTPFIYTAPADPRLNGGGSEKITLYNLKPSLVGIKSNYLSNSTDFRDYNGFEATSNFRLPRQAFLFTSVTFGKTHTYSCTRDNPNDLRYCDTTTPYRVIYKLSGGVPLKYKITLSGNFQIYDAPGSGLFLTPPYFAANQTVTAAVAGQPITGGQATSSSITVNMLQPNTIFQDYYKIADVRVAKTMTVGRMRTTALAEFNNLFNMLSVASVTQNYGANWLRPATVQRGLNIRFGVQIAYYARERSTADSIDRPCFLSNPS